MTLKTKYQLGKNGIADNMIAMLDKALTAHELIKVDVLNSVDDSINELALELSIKLKAELVQTVGKVIILYRRNKENPKIQLVK